MPKRGRYRFSFGPWNISTGADPFGPPVRREVKFARKVGEYRKLGFEYIQLHDDDVVPADWDVAQTRRGVARVSRLLDDQGVKPEFIAPRLWEHPKTVDGAFTVVATVPVSILSNPTTMTRADVERLHELGADIFTVALDAATPELFDRTRGKGVQSPHNWKKYWEILEDARDIFGPKKFGAHIIVGMGETEAEILHLVQQLVDMGGHSHMFCFYPEEGSLMDHLPATPRDQWRRVQLARYLIDYCDVRVDQMKFDEEGRVRDFGMSGAELDIIIDAGIAFRTSGCPGKFADDISACDRPYGDSPPSDIASYPFQPADGDLRRIRHQLDMEKPGEAYEEGDEFEGLEG